jgi:hypothetical protein
MASINVGRTCGMGSSARDTVDQAKFDLVGRAAGSMVEQQLDEPGVGSPDGQNGPQQSADPNGQHSQPPRDVADLSPRQ